MRLAGRGEISGVFMPAGGDVSRPCVVKGRVRAQVVLTPSAGLTRRFHTGTFEGRGRCDGERVIVRAIWSGATEQVDGPIFMDFQRFFGQLAGTFRFQQGGSSNRRGR
jgi:hypothetical protein